MHVTVRVVDLGSAAVVRGAPRPSLRPALRELVAQELGVDLAAVSLTSRPGRPAMAGGPRDLDLSASSSGQVGLVALARGGSIGIDVQSLEDDDVTTAFDEGWLSVRERDGIAAQSTPAARIAALTRAWAQKEAVLKGDGVGLRGDLARTETPLADHGRIGRWRVIPIAVPSGHVASLAVRPRSFLERLCPVQVTVR